MTIAKAPPWPNLACSAKADAHLPAADIQFRHRSRGILVALLANTDNTSHHLRAPAAPILWHSTSPGVRTTVMPSGTGVQGTAGGAMRSGAP